MRISIDINRYSTYLNYSSDMINTKILKDVLDRVGLSLWIYSRIGPVFGGRDLCGMESMVVDMFSELYTGNFKDTENLVRIEAPDRVFMFNKEQRDEMQETIGKVGAFLENHPYPVKTSKIY